MSDDTVLSLWLAWLLLYVFFFPEDAGKWVASIQKAYQSEMSVKVETKP